MTEADYLRQQDREDDLARIHRVKQKELKNEAWLDDDIAFEVLTEEEYTAEEKREIGRALRHTEAFLRGAIARAMRLADRHCDALEAARKEPDHD